MALTIEERHGWLANLSLAKLQALAHQWGIMGYESKSSDDLRKLLVRIENVEVPLPA